MRRLLLSLLLALLLLATVSALPSITHKIGNGVYTENVLARVEQDKAFIKSGEEARLRITEKSMHGVKNLCFNFHGVNISLVEMQTIKKSRVLIWDENLKPKEDKKSGLICYKQAVASSEEIYYTLTYSGYGVVKYDVILDNNSDSVTLDPYVVGVLSSDNELLMYLPLNNSIEVNFTSYSVPYTSASSRTQTTPNVVTTGGWTNQANGYDASFSTYASTTGGAYYIFQITKNAADTGMSWYTQFYYDYPSRCNTLVADNYTLPSSCFNASTSAVNVSINTTVGGVGGYSITAQCQTIGGWYTLFTTSASGSCSGDIYRYYDSIFYITNSTSYSPYNTTAQNVEYIVANYSVFAGYPFRITQDRTDIFGAASKIGTCSKCPTINSSGAYFDGLNQYINVSTNLSNAFTVAGKFAVTRYSNLGAIASRYSDDAGVNTSFMAAIDASNRFVCLGYNTTAAYIWANSTGVILGNRTYSFACVFNATTIKLYLDGVLNATASRATSINNLAPSVNGTLKIGSGWVTPLNGTIYSIMFFNDTLDAETVRRLHTNGTFYNYTENDDDQEIGFNSTGKDALVTSNITLGTDYSISLWFNATSLNAYNFLWYNGTSGIGEMYCAIQSTGLITCSAGGTYFYTTSPITTGRMYHLVFTKSSTSGKIYLNGILNTSGTVAASTYTGRLIIGSYGIKTISNSHIGLLDEVMVYNRAITPEEVATLYGGFNSSISLYIRDEDTEELIPNTVIEYYSDLQSGGVTAANGTTFINGLAPGNYTFHFSATGYEARDYAYTVGDDTHESETAYLSESDLETTFTYKDIDSNSPIAGVRVTQERVIGSSFVIVSERDTDITGRVKFVYGSGVRYRFTSEKDGYEDKDFYLDPVLFDSYTIKMQRTTTVENASQSVGVLAYYEPKVFKVNDTGSFEMTFSSPAGLFTSYGFNLTYPGTSSAQYTGTDTEGEIFTHTYNLTNATGASTFNVTYWYTTTPSGYRIFRDSYRIAGLTGGNTSLERMRPANFGLGVLEGVLVAVILTGILAVIFAAVSGLPGAAVAIIIGFGFFIKVGFLPFWGGILAMIVAGFIAIKGGSQ